VWLTIGIGITAFHDMSWGWEVTGSIMATVLISGPRRIGAVVVIEEDAKAVTWRYGISWVVRVPGAKCAGPLCCEFLAVGAVSRTNCWWGITWRWDNQ